MAIAVALTAILWLPNVRQPRRLNIDAFGKIQLGMTQEKVETLLGGPPGDYGVNRRGVIMMTAEGNIAQPGSIEKVWFNDNNRFEIFFDNQNRVVGFHKRVIFERKPPPSLWARLLRRLRGAASWLTRQRPR